MSSSILAQEAAFGFLENAQSRYIRAPSIMKVRSTALPLGKSSMRDVVSEHRNLRAAVIFFVGEVAALEESARRQIDRVRRRADDRQLVGVKSRHFSCDDCAVRKREE